MEIDEPVARVIKQVANQTQIDSTEAINARLGRLYPSVTLSSIPMQWRKIDLFNGELYSIELRENRTVVEYQGNGETTHRDARAVRTETPIPRTCGLFYFEIEVISKGKNGYIAVGVADDKVKLARLPGWDENSYGYHGDDGNVFTGSGTGVNYGPTFTTGDVIGCCYDLAARTIFFTKNGENLDTAFQDVSQQALYPVLGLQTQGEIVRVNFGQSDFVFNFESYSAEWRRRQQMRVEKWRIENLNGNYDDMMKRIVHDYLKYQGYRDSSKKFAAALRIEEDEELSEEDDDAETRLELANLVIEGKLTETINLTQLNYPGLLEKDDEINFTLKYRQLIELIGGTQGEMAKYTGENKTDTICNGNIEAIKDMIEQGRHLNELIERSTLTNREEKRQMIAAASLLLTDTDPLKGPQAHLFTLSEREKTAQLLGRAIARHRGHQKTSSALSYLINHSSYLYERFRVKELAQSSFLEPSLYLK